MNVYRTIEHEGRMAVILDARDLFSEPVNMVTLAITDRKWTPGDMYSPTPASVSLSGWKIADGVCTIETMDGPYRLAVVVIETPIAKPRGKSWRWIDGRWQKRA